PGGSVALSKLIEQSYLNLSENSAQGSNVPAQSVSYDDLINLAIQEISGGNYAAAGQALDKAVTLDPTQPRAYQVAGFTLLYGGGDIALAEQVMWKAIVIGGLASFGVPYVGVRDFTKDMAGSLFVS